MELVVRLLPQKLLLIVMLAVATILVAGCRQEVSDTGEEAVGAHFSSYYPLGGSRTPIRFEDGRDAIWYDDASYAATVVEGEMVGFFNPAPTTRDGHQLHFSYDVNARQVGDNWVFEGFTFQVVGIEEHRPWMGSEIDTIIISSHRTGEDGEQGGGCFTIQESLVCCSFRSENILMSAANVSCPSDHTF